MSTRPYTLAVLVASLTVIIHGELARPEPSPPAEAPAAVGRCFQCQPMVPPKHRWRHCPATEPDPDNPGKLREVWYRRGDVVCDDGNTIMPLLPRDGWVKLPKPR